MDRCYDFKNIYTDKIWRKYWRFLLKLLLLVSKNLIITLVFEKKREFFLQKLAKIAQKLHKNCTKIAQKLHKNCTKIAQKL
jgi:hypothetical protein